MFKAPHASKRTLRAIASAAAAAVTLGLGVLPARADVITDWNQRSAALITEARIGTPPAIRVMALVQTAAFEAVRATQSADAPMQAAAVAGAHRAAFTRLLPAQKASIEATFNAAMAALGDEARVAQLASSVALGEQAAARVFAARADEMPPAGESYRPHTTPGIYVPTVTPAVVTWSQRKPWLMSKADEFRPGPPPVLASEPWARDFNEVKLLGGKDSKARSAEQTEIARFWDYSLPAIYHGVVRSVAQQSGRSVLANARLFAAVAQGMDDAMISVFDAKYAFNYWRPGTAIRNADQDGNDATERDPRWSPLIDVPMHPEYPSGHSILAAAVATLLEAEMAGAPMPVLATSSPTANNATRRWPNTREFVREVSVARIYGGLHFRSATDAGEAMGRRIGALHAERTLAPAH
jgi:hypothetical protein